jgi:hypothetical protein
VQYLIEELTKIENFYQYKFISTLSYSFSYIIFYFIDCKTSYYKYYGCLPYYIIRISVCKKRNKSCKVPAGVEECRFNKCKQNPPTQVTVCVCTFNQIMLHFLYISVVWGKN